MIPVQRSTIRLKPDPRRVVPRFLDFGKAERFEPVVQFVLGLEEQAAEAELEKVRSRFEHRHLDLTAIFKENYEKLTSYVKGVPSTTKKQLLGAYFTHEYSVEAAALFNPSIVPHPDQSGLKEGELRFILSLRATGEGHISSVGFQSGLIAADGSVGLDERNGPLSTGTKLEDPRPDKPESGEDLSYQVEFDPDVPLGNRILFPHSSSESNGMEDARFVAFSDAENSTFLGTYTAYNGRSIQPQLIETEDFIRFRIRPFYGKAVSDKGMAFFPEKINGQYAMVGRQGGRVLSIMYSDDLYRWESYQPLQLPQRSWEYVQMGNCGSPVKTPHGWLLLTHAVGPMRRYVLSCTLLDLHKPGQVLASLEQPLMSPNEEEREGYVPNVLYTCGWIAHGENLIIPYAMSDSAISFATVKQEHILNELLHKTKR